MARTQKEVSPYEQTRTQEFVGSVARFIGEIKSAKALLGRVGIKSPGGKKLIQKIGANAPAWMTSGAINALVEGIVKEKPAKDVLKDMAAKAAIRGAEAIVWSSAEWGGAKLLNVALRKFPRFASGFNKWIKGKKPPEVRAARQEVDAALKEYRRTGDRTPWDNVRIKYAGITPEGVAKIKARATPPVKEFGKYPLAKVKAKPAISKPVIKPKVIVPEVKPEAPATTVQKAKAHIVARKKAFVSEKGKMRPGYRALAKAMTGKRSIKDMTSQEAERFIDSLSRLPEPTIRKGKAVPPSIPRTTRLATVKQFQRTYKKPTPLKLITPQT